VVWYEWLDETWAILKYECVIEFGFRVKTLTFFMGREDPIEFDICLILVYVLVLLF